MFGIILLLCFYYSVTEHMSTCDGILMTKAIVVPMFIKELTIDFIILKKKSTGIKNQEQNLYFHYLNILSTNINANQRE